MKKKSVKIFQTNRQSRFCYFNKTAGHNFVHRLNDFYAQLFTDVRTPPLRYILRMDSFCEMEIKFDWKMDTKLFRQMSNKKIEKILISFDAQRNRFFYVYLQTRAADN